MKWNFLLLKAPRLEVPVKVSETKWFEIWQLWDTSRKKNCGTRLNHVGGSHVSEIDAMPFKVETLDGFHFLNLWQCGSYVVHTFLKSLWCLPELSIISKSSQVLIWETSGTWSSNQWKLDAPASIILSRKHHTSIASNLHVWKSYHTTAVFVKGLTRFIIFRSFRNVIIDLTNAAFMEELTRPVVRVFTSHGTGSLVLPIQKMHKHHKWI